jgi:HEAT repeat protein
MHTEARTQAAGTKELDATAKAVGAWVNQLGRTLKTCRLYDGNNPTVIKFREELSATLARLLDEHGSIALRFSDEDVLYEEYSLYPARSREDNLALVFHRDGVRGITFSPGIERQEMDRVLDAILHVSGQQAGENDLVTLLWEAHLPHLEIDYVSAEGDIGSGETGGGEAGEEPGGVPWPKSGSEPGDGSTGSASTADATDAATAAAGAVSRSDDWTAGELTGEIEAGFAELEALAPAEVPRFLSEFQAEHEVPPSEAALAVLRAALGTDVNPEDRAEFAQFVPRLLRLSVGRGAWLEATEALGILKATGDEAGFAALTQELLQPISIANAVEQLDQQDSPLLLDFIQLARAMGDAGIDLLNGVLADSQQRRNRRLLTDAIADLCRDNPERLAPWLSDRRWYVVRNIVHILGAIGGEQIVGLLRGVIDHPESRVRSEVVVSLGQIDAAVARPMLLKMLDGANTRQFCAVLHQLSAVRDARTARMLLSYLLDPAFESRPPEEKRAIYSAIGATGDDDVVPELEAELLKGNWFTRGQDTHRQAVARMLARIGTPLAREALQHGTLSKRPP